MRVTVRFDRECGGGTANQRFPTGTNRRAAALQGTLPMSLARPKSLSRLAALVLSVLALRAAAAAQYSASSSVGSFAIPSAAPTGSGGGTWPTVMPTGGDMTSIPLSTGVPANAVNINRVVLNSLVHTCSGDLHI